MNILIYSSNSRYGNKCVGGAETALELIARKLNGLGEAVSLATVEACVDKERIKAPYTSFKEKKIDGLNVYNLPPLTGPEDQKLSLIDPQIQKFIAHVVRSKKIEIAHSYEIIDTLNLLKAREDFKLNFKVVKRVAGLFWEYAMNKKLITKESIEWVFNSVDAVNYLTPQSRTLVLEIADKYKLNIRPKHEIISDIGIDLDLFPYRWQPKTSKPYKIVSVLRFALYQKKPDLLIEALSLCKHNDIIIDFIGVGKDLQKCKELCFKLGLNDRINFHGYLAQEQIAQLLEVADLFALPSLDEGLPKSLLEAMACGTPALVSDVSPLNGYIRHNCNGFLVRNDPKEWAETIDQLYSRPDDLKNISGDARNFVQQNYNADKNIHQYRKNFQELLS